MVDSPLTGGEDRSAAGVSCGTMVDSPLTGGEDRSAAGVLTPQGVIIDTGARELVLNVIQHALANVQEQDKENFQPRLIKTDDGQDMVIVKKEDSTGSLEERYELMEFELYEQYMKEKGTFSPRQSQFSCDLENVFGLPDESKSSSFPEELEFAGEEEEEEFDSERPLLASHLSIIMEEPPSSAESSLSGSVIKCKTSQSSNETGEYVVTSPTEFDIVQSTVREVHSRRQRPGAEEVDEVRGNLEEAGDEFMLLWRSTRNGQQDWSTADDSTINLGEEQHVAESEGVGTSDVTIKHPGLPEEQKEEKDGKEETDYLRLATLQAPEESSECLAESSGSSVRSWVSSDLSSLDDDMTSARLVKDRSKVEGISEEQAMESVCGEEGSNKEVSTLGPSTVVHSSEPSGEPDFYAKHVSVSTEKDVDKTTTTVTTTQTTREVKHFEYGSEEAPANDTLLGENDGVLKETKTEVDGDTTTTTVIKTQTTREVKHFEYGSEEAPANDTLLGESDGVVTETKTEVDGDTTTTTVIKTQTSREVTRLEYCSEEAPDNDTLLAESDGVFREMKTEVREVTNLETRTELGKLY